MPLRHRHGYAAGIHRGLRTDDQNRWRSSPPHEWWVRAADQPRSVRFELEGGLRSFQTLVSHVHRPVLLAEPGPSDSAGPVPALSGLLATQQARSGLPGCPQLQLSAATNRRRCPFITARFNSASWRTKSPSQCPGTARSATSAGRSTMLIIPAIPRGRPASPSAR